MKLRSFLIVLAVVAMAASACSSGSNASLRPTANAGVAAERPTSPSSQDVDQDQRLTVARVGAEAGGVVELAGRARLRIPPGALTADAEVRLTAVGAAPSAIAFPLEQAVAQPVNVEIRRAELTEPATLELLFNAETVKLPQAPIIPTASQWSDAGWLKNDAAIDADEGVVSIETDEPNGWWRPSVWDWGRVPAVVDSLFFGLDEAEVPEPDCNTKRPDWVATVLLDPSPTDPALTCAGGFEGTLAIRMTNQRPFSIAVASTREPAWGWTNTSNQVHNFLVSTVRSAQPGFVPQFILPRFTPGALGINPGDFEGGRVIGFATART